APAAGGRSSPGPSRCGSGGSADGPPAAARGGAGRPVRAPPQRRAARRLAAPRPDRPRGAHALLLLRAAVRDPAEGRRRPGRRLRAPLRLPLQPGEALPEGRQALPAGQPPRPAARPAGAHAGRVRAGVVGRGARAHGARAPADPGRARARRRRRPRGASLTTEKSYLLGKLARLALGTRHIDYNGRLCMVSAGVGYKKAFGVDRAPNPWSDIPHADVVFVIGANIADCAPITTSYIWRARDRGARLIVADPRVTPIARTADLFLGLRPGTDSALLSAMLHHLIARDLV